MQEHAGPRELSLAVRDLSLAALNLHHALAERLGTNPQDLAAITHLGRDGPLTPSELRARLRLRAGSVTAVVDRLERRGQVRRVPRPADRRSVLVGLTEGGSTRARAELVPLIEAVEAAAAQLSESERSVVLSFLRLCTAAMSSHARAIPERGSHARGPGESR